MPVKQLLLIWLRPGPQPFLEPFLDAFMRGEVAEVRSLPTKTSLRELGRCFLSHVLLFAAPLPHAPGARMTVVTLTPSKSDLAQTCFQIGSTGYYVPDAP